MSSWTESVIWWQVYPLGFVGAEQTALPPGPPSEHRLPATAALARLPGRVGLQRAGAEPGVRLGKPRLRHRRPFRHRFPAGRRRRHRPAHRGLPRQGHPGAVRRGLQPRRPGLPRFRRCARQPQESAWADWFDIDWDGDGPDGFGYRTFEGHGGLVALNHDSPAVADYVVSVMEHWLDRGIDGWRLDAAYAVPLPFWRSVTDRVRGRFPDAWFVGEVIHGEFGDWVSGGRAGFGHPVRAVEIDLELAE